MIITNFQEIYQTFDIAGLHVIGTMKVLRPADKANKMTVVHGNNEQNHLINPMYCPTTTYKLHKFYNQRSALSEMFVPSWMLIAIFGRYLYLQHLDTKPHLLHRSAYIVLLTTFRYLISPRVLSKKDANDPRRF